MIKGIGVHIGSMALGGFLVALSMVALPNASLHTAASPLNFQSLEQVSVDVAHHRLVSTSSGLPGAVVTVPFRSNARAIMLDTQVDQKKTATFILDSGATYTTISRAMAQDLGYDLSKSPTVTVTTANGKVSMPRIMLKSITLNGYTVENVEATVMDMPANVQFSGLLGLNFIRRQRLTIDAASDQLVLHPSSFSS